MKFDRRWLPLNAMRTFEATGKALSFTAAGEALGVTQSAVSRQVASLEKLLGVKLLERHARDITLAPKGKLLLARITESFDILERSLKEIVEGDSREVYRLSIVTSFAHCIGPRVVADFVKKYPLISLAIDSQGDLIDIDGTDYDMAIVFSKPSVTHHLTDLLWQEQVSLLCSPELIAAGGASDLPALTTENILLHVRTEEGPYHAWDRWAQAAGLEHFDTSRGLTFDSAMLAVRYAVEGKGLLVADPRLFEREIESGTLCMPYPIRCETGFGYYLMMRQDDIHNERLQFFRKWMLDHFTQ